MLKAIIKWFMIKAWPIILQFIKKYEEQITEFIFTWIKDILKKREEATKEEFKNKAEEAEKKAEKAKDTDSKNRYQTKAEAYREAAIILEKQNKKLREELEETKQNLQNEINKNIASLRAEDLFSADKKGELVVKSNDNYLLMKLPKK